MVTNYSVSTLIEREVEERVKCVVASIQALVRKCEETPSIKDRTHLEWRAHTLRDSLKVLAQPKPPNLTKKSKVSRDERDIAADVARSLKEEMGWER